MPNGAIPATSQQEFSDADFRIVDNGDQSKKVAFQVSGLTTGTTRVWTAPDKDGTVAMLSDIPAASTPFTLLATIATTSGSTASGTWTGATYRRLYIEVDGVVFGNNTAHLLIALSSNGGSGYGTAVQCAPSKTAAGDTHYGWLEIGNASSTSSGRRVILGMIENTNTITLAATNLVAVSTSAAEINGVQFSCSASTFSAGSIRVYGMK